MPQLHHGLVKEGLQKIAGKFSSEKDFGPRSVADFEEIDDPEEKEPQQLVDQAKTTFAGPVELAFDFMEFVF